jgi:hypothetical protein
MLVVLWGGFLLFTNIILFQSIHFDTIRPLTVIECIYFMAQVITTVGYGDITPAKPRGQVFVGLYVLGALFIISMLISDLTNYIVQRFAERHAGAEKKEEKKTTLTDLVIEPRPSVQPLLTALATFAFFDICWVLFFWLHPDEGKNLFQAIYMSVITLSTVGFGWFTPVTEEGMIFGAFWMLFGSTALVAVISQFTDLMVKLQQYEKNHPAHAPEGYKEAMTNLKAIIGDDATMVTESQFIQFVLTHGKMVSQELFDDIVKAFSPLSKQGSANLKDVTDVLHQEFDEAAKLETVA